MMLQTRIRGRRWQEIRERILAVEPLCRSCAARGKVEPATVIDHIVPISKGGSPDASTNLRPLCNECHRDVTAAQFGQRQKHKVGIDGWPEKFAGLQR
jgi:5-methylcytosine-specific restriction protein A